MDRRLDIRTRDLHAYICNMYMIPLLLLIKLIGMLWKFVIIIIVGITMNWMKPILIVSICISKYLYTNNFCFCWWVCDIIVNLSLSLSFVLLTIYAVLIIKHLSPVNKHLCIRYSLRWVLPFLVSCVIYPFCAFYFYNNSH